MKRLIQLLLVAVVLSLCEGCLYNESVIRETTTQARTAISIENTQETKPDLLISETSTPTPAHTETTPISEIIPSCSTMTTDLLHLDTPLAEFLLIQQDEPSTIFAVNGQVQKELITLDDIEYILGISPSGDRVITFQLQNYKDFAGREENLRIITSNLDFTNKTFSLDDLRSWLVDSTTPSEEVLLSWGFSGYWINEDLVYINVGWKSAPDALTASFIPMIINPIEGTWQFKLLDDLPKLDKHGSVLYSPDLTRVLYTADKEVLYDTQSRKLLWARTLLLLPYLQPLNGSTTGPFNSDWSGNSEYLALVIDDHFVPSKFPKYADRLIQGILILDREGNEIIKVVNPYEAKGQPSVNGLKWSRDSKRLAFILHYEANNNHVKETNELFVYDIERKAIIFGCPLQNTLPYPIFDLSWSPTDRYIAINQNVDSPSYVLDLLQGQETLIKIDDNAKIVGWSNTFGSDAR